MAGIIRNCSSQQPAEPQLQRLHFLVSGLCSRFRLGTLAYVQVWMENPESSVDTHHEGVPLLCSPLQPCFVGLPSLQAFRSTSCENGVTTQELGLLGRAFTGSLQVVQNLSIVPRSQHPRNKLKGHESSISEVVYIPVYDQEKLEEGVFAVVEVMIASETAESMAVANLITYASRFMEDVSLSITHEPPEELSSRSSSATSSSTCSTPGSLDYPHPRWQVSPRVDASDTHLPSISRQSWTQHPITPRTSLKPTPSTCSDCSLSETTHSGSRVGTHQLQPDAAPFTPSRSNEPRRPPAKQRSVPRVDHHQAATAPRRRSEDPSELVSPFAQVSVPRVSPTHESLPGGLKRSPSISRTTSSRSLSDMSSGPPKGLSESPSQAWSEGACPAIPEVSSSPHPPPSVSPLPEEPTWAATHPAPPGTAVQGSGEFADGRASLLTAAVQQENGASETGRSYPPGHGNSKTPPRVSAAEAATPPQSQEQPIKMPWWRIPASKLIPGIGPVSPLAVC